MIKSGSTVWQRFRIDIELSMADSIIITYSTREHEEIILQKRYPEDTVIDGDLICVPLSQEETELLHQRSGDVALVEMQYNLSVGTVAKSNIEEVYLGDTLATEFVDGSYAAAVDETGIINMEVTNAVMCNDGMNGLGVYTVNSECSGSSVMIFKSDISVPDGRELAKGDLLFVSQNNMMYTVTEVGETSVTAYYVSTLKGEKGSSGAAGEKGDPGYTPVKGIDYWTDSDIAEIMTAVDQALNAKYSTLDERISALEASASAEYDGSVSVSGVSADAMV